MLSRPMEKVLGHFLWGAGPMLGSVHKLREGEGMGDLRGEELKMFYIKKGGRGPEMLPEHRGENLKYLTSKNIKGSFLQSSKAI